MSEPLLKNKSELAHVLGVSRDWILAMQYAGFAMPGGRATVDDALAWLRAHPDFSTTRELKKGRKARREVKKPASKLNTAA